MKTKQEILFDHYQVDTNGAPVLEDSDIFAAMDESNKLFGIELLMWYIGGTPSKYEVTRIVTDFLQSDYLKERTQ
jgi:hypothetical protein